MVERIQELDDDRKSAESAANDAENRAAMADGGSLSSDPGTAAAARWAAGNERQNAANLRARVRSDNDEILSLTRQIEELKYAESTDGAPPRPKPAASSSDPLVGSWNLSAGKSTFAEEAPKQETREVEPAKGGIHAADTAVYKDGRTRSHRMDREVRWQGLSLQRRRDSHHRHFSHQRSLLQLQNQTERPRDQRRPDCL